MKEVDPDRVAKFEALRKAIAEQEPVRAEAIKAYNAAVEAALQRLHEAGAPFFGLLHEADLLHLEVGREIQAAVEDAEGDGRDEEADLLQDWLEAWDEVGSDMAITNADNPTRMKPPSPPISALLAKLPYRPADVERPPAGDRAIDPSVKASVESSWRRIDAWLARVAPGLAGRMNPGASPGGIAEAEKGLGMELPEAVRASYLVHDGSGVMALFPQGDYLSLRQMLDEYARWKCLVEEGLGDEGGDPEGPIQKVHCHPRWIPITDFRSGDHLMIDLAPAEGGKVGQLINFSHETGPEDVVAPGLAEYLAHLADGLEAGAATIGDDTYLAWNFARDTPGPGDVHPENQPAPATPPAPTTIGPAPRYFEFTEGTSSKFWEITREEAEMTTRYGKIGTRGQSTTKTFDTPQKAEAETAKIVAKKVKEGYVEKPG